MKTHFRDSVVFTKFVLGHDEEFAFRLDIDIPDGIYHISGPLWVEGENVIVRGPYAWDGNSVKVEIGPVVLGVSDGPILPDGTPAGKWPSCGHDVVYEYWPHVVSRFEISGARLRLAVDRWFRDEWLRRLASLPDDSERARWTRLVKMCYYPAVRLLGAPLWWRRALGRQ